MTDPVILIHGLWLRAWTLGRLAARLGAAGFACQRFDYPSLVAGRVAPAELLAERLRACPQPPHLIGHSLGGLLALEVLCRHPDLQVGRVVCLGSPLAGSAAAVAMSANPGLRWLLGHQAVLLAQGIPRCPDGRAVGVVAGRLGLGLGRVFGPFDGPHDGTVAVAETRIPGLTDHCTVAASHSGLLLSPETARQTAAFLRHGRFGPPTPWTS